MDWRGIAFIWGILALVVALIWLGIHLGTGWGAVMVLAGVVVGIVWLIMIFDILCAMNSDI